MDPQEIRWRGFAALRELLTRLGDRCMLVLYVDDLHWGDLDSAALLTELLRPPNPPGLLLIVCCRDEDIKAVPVLGLLLQPFRSGRLVDDVREIEVGPLSPRGGHDDGPRPHERGRGGESAHRRTDRRGVGGRSLFRGGAGLALPGRGRGPPGAKGPPARDLAGSGPAGAHGPSPRGRTPAAHGGRRRRPARVVVRRRVRGGAGGGERERPGRPARGSPRQDASGPSAPGGGVVSRPHSRNRGALAGRNDPAGMAPAAGLRARWRPREWTTKRWRCTSSGPATRSEPPSTASIAAAAAAKALAFEHAARLYERALELRPPSHPERRELWSHLGRALACAGRGLEAARAYEEAAKGASAAESLECRRRAAEQLLRSGHVDEGLAVLESVLSAVGLRLSKSPKGALLSLLFRRAVLAVRGLGFAPRDASEDPRGGAHPDRCVLGGGHRAGPDRQHPRRGFPDTPPAARAQGGRELSDRARARDRSGVLVNPG